MTYDTFLTAQQILTPARDEAISSSSSQVTALQDTQMLEFINTLVSDFILAAHTQHHAGGFSWMRKTDNFRTVSHNSLSAAISAGSATFTLNSATNWDTSGRSIIETNKGALDFVDHTNKSSNTLTVSTVTGAETVSFSHATDRVHKLYPVPTGFNRVHKLWVNNVPFKFVKFDGLFPIPCNFTTYGGYFLFPRGMYNADVTVLYERKPTVVTSLTTETDIPREFLRYAVEMTLHHVYGIRRKRADAPTSLALAQIALEKALMYDSTDSSSNHISLA